MNTPRHHETLAIPTGNGRDAVRRRPGGRSARVQAAVFEATFQLLEERGYEGLSMASIAERAGVHETSLYRRWKMKEQLVLDAVNHRVAQDIPVPDTGALRSDLVAVLRSLRLFLQSRGGQAIFQTAVATLHLPELCALRQEHWRQRRAHLQILFDRAIARGELSPQVDCQFLLETLSGIMYMRLFVVNEPVDEMLSEQVVDLILLGANQLHC
ncbi:putative transcriptional regulator, TetR family protein [Ktedonobacter sp. SOSP1-85]|uniref:TetR/AcrR family transcriptional regulator n=1 Tax=Ktedonobacter sp. SOSP1-85 TaxID=2778367 RepID=UPI0019165ECA|nr:TetR/AcrR family transcriptional regulator [Ktedonobacter sp. SOSP1-85]GHO79868.1 putative transcriptional regulator, TetR family protein [Ktedonobacter sp. SOSP1-85]